MKTAAHKQADGEFAVVEVRAVKGGWVTFVGTDGAERKARKSEFADFSDVADVELTDDEGGDDQDGAPRTGNVFPSHIRARYAKGKAANGKAFIDSGDELAEALRGMEVRDVAELAAQRLGGTAEGWIALYTTDRAAAGKQPLNAGMVRMNLGNRIRAAQKRDEAERAEFSQPEAATAE